MIIDAHTHVWSGDPVSYPWQPTFGYIPEVAASPETLLASMDACRIAFAVIVQSSVYGDDHRFVLDTVAAHPDRFVAVGQVDPQQPSSFDQARALVEANAVVGLRVIFAVDPALAQAQASSRYWDGLVELGVTISLRAMPIHHRLVLSLLRRFPRACFVVDHLGLPNLADLTGAARRLAELARFDNCSVKIAGLARLRADLGTSVSPTLGWPLVRQCLRTFGPARMVWGSDFPSCDERTALKSSLDDVTTMPFIDDGVREQVLGGTAVRLWGLPRGPSVVAKADDAPLPRGRRA